MKLTLDAREVADLVGYRGPETIRTLYRTGKFPPPIDPSLTVHWWRWSRRRVEQYVETGQP
jgi:predicted DNA-binding transcriptional regulator AlpA